MNWSTLAHPNEDTPASRTPVAVQARVPAAVSIPTKLPDWLRDVRPTTGAPIANSVDIRNVGIRCGRPEGSKRKLVQIQMKIELVLKKFLYFFLVSSDKVSKMIDDRKYWLSI